MSELQSKFNIEMIDLILKELIKTILTFYFSEKLGKIYIKYLETTNFVIAVLLKALTFDKLTLMAEELIWNLTLSHSYNFKIAISKLSSENKNLIESSLRSSIKKLKSMKIQDSGDEL